MIIGFGSTEKEVEARLQREIISLVESECRKAKMDYFTDDFIGHIKQCVDTLAKESRAKSDSYKDAKTFPDRYSGFWVYTLGDCNHIAFIVTFHHINRRHGLSPDGWALLESEVVFQVSHLDMPKAEAA